MRRCLRDRATRFIETEEEGPLNSLIFLATHTLSWPARVSSPCRMIRKMLFLKMDY